MYYLFPSGRPKIFLPSPFWLSFSVVSFCGLWFTVAVVCCSSYHQISNLKEEKKTCTSRPTLCSQAQNCKVSSAARKAFTIKRKQSEMSVITPEDVVKLTKPTDGGIFHFLSFLFNFPHFCYSRFFLHIFNRYGDVFG